MNRSRCICTYVYVKNHFAHDNDVERARERETYILAARHCQEKSYYSQTLVLFPLLPSCRACAHVVSVFLSSLFFFLLSSPARKE